MPWLTIDDQPVSHNDDEFNQVSSHTLLYMCMYMYVYVCVYVYIYIYILNVCVWVFGVCMHVCVYVCVLSPPARAIGCRGVSIHKPCLLLHF